MNSKTKNLIELNAAVLLWGLTAQFPKLIDLPADQIIFGRNIFSALILLAFGYFAGESLRIRSRRDGLALLLISACMCIHWVTYFQSIQASTVAIGLVALHVYPVMIALAEPWFFRERLRAFDVGLALLVLVGVLVMVPEYNLADKTTWGIVLGVISACFLSTRNILTRKYVARYTPTTMMFYQCALTVVFLLYVGVPMIAGEESRVDLRQVVLLAILGVFFTALPHTLYTSSFRHLKAKTVAIIGTLLPVYGAVFAIFILDETPTPRTIVGGAIVLSAALIESIRAVK